MRTGTGDGRGGGAETAVVGLGAGHDVLDVGLSDGFEPGAGVGSVDAAYLGHYPGFHRGRVGVVSGVVWRAPMFLGEGDPAPGVGGGFHRGCRG